MVAFAPARMPDGLRITAGARSFLFQPKGNQMREENASDWPEEEPEEWQVSGNFPKTDEPQATSSVSSLLNSPLPKVQLPGDNRLLSAFAADCARVVKDCGIYQRGGVAFIVNQQRDGLEVITPALLRTLAEKHLVCFRIRQSGDNVLSLARTMTSEDAQGCFRRSNSFLPAKVVRIATARLPDAGMARSNCCRMVTIQNLLR